MKTCTVAVLAISLGACASTATQTAAVDPVRPSAVVQPPPPPPAPAFEIPGAYEFTTVVEGQTVTGTMFVTAGATAGMYGGRITTNMFPEIPVTGASSSGQSVTVKASMPDGGELTITIVMDGANFRGKWELGGDSGEFNGRKLLR